MADNITKWTTEEEDKLIQLWRDRPILYDKSDRDYHNRMQKGVELESIALQMEKPVVAIKNQLENLRTQFVRLDKLPISSSGQKLKTFRQEWIDRQLDFLRPHIQKRKSKASTVLEIKQEEILDEEPEDDSSTPPLSPASPHMASYTSMMTSSSSAKRKYDGPLQRYSKAKRRNDLELMGRIADSLEKAAEAKDPRHQQTEDEDEIFGQLVASKLKKIPDLKVKNRLTVQILELIIQAQANSVSPRVDKS